MVAVPISQSAHATTKRMESCRADVLRASAGLRQYVGSNVPARRPSGRRSSTHRFLGGEAA